MILEQIGEVQLPAHDKPGGFDHAAVHGQRGRLYVAQTANDALDVIDCATNTHLSSILRLEGVAGALVSEEHDLVFTSNRAENTVGIFPSDHDEALVKVKVGLRPNGLAYDAGRRLLLAANVGDPARPGSFSVSVVDASARAMIVDVPVSGRTRWVVFDGETDWFYINIADPPEIAVVEAADPTFVARTFAVVPAAEHMMYGPRSSKGFALSPFLRAGRLDCGFTYQAAAGAARGATGRAVAFGSVTDYTPLYPRSDPTGPYQPARTMTCVRERTCGANWYQPRMAWNSGVAMARGRRSRDTYGADFPENGRRRETPRTSLWGEHGLTNHRGLGPRPHKRESPDDGHRGGLLDYDPVNSPDWRHE